MLRSSKDGKQTGILAQSCSLALPEEVLSFVAGFVKVTNFNSQKD